MAADGKGEVLYDSDDTHLRSLEVLPGGDVLVGTAGEGLILRLGQDGKARTLYDADEPEVVALAAAPDGTCYAAVVASEASLVDLSPARGRRPPGRASPGHRHRRSGGAGRGRPTGHPPARRHAGRAASPAHLAGRRGRDLWSFQDDTVYALLWPGPPVGGHRPRGQALQLGRPPDAPEKDVDERQIVALLPGEAGPAFATTNAAAFYRITAETEKPGTYTSAALDAGQAARFGTFRWRGETPGGQRACASPSAAASAPSRTAPGRPGPRRATGEEIALDACRAAATSSGGPSWRRRTAASRRGSTAPSSPTGRRTCARASTPLGALEPGQILVPSNFNPSNQVYEPAHPNREGIFTTLGSPRTRTTAAAPSRSGRRASAPCAGTPPTPTRTASSTTSRSGRPDVGRGRGCEVADELKDDCYSFDATVLPDGVYRFRLRASDGPTNDPDSALVAERVSEPVVVDHTPPLLGKVGRDGRASCASRSATRRTRCARPSSASTPRSGSRCASRTACSTARPRRCVVGARRKTGRACSSCGSPTPPSTSSPSTSPRPDR